jgi:two-component system, NtrC family, sensor kinase
MIIKNLQRTKPAISLPISKARDLRHFSINYPQLYFACGLFAAAANAHGQMLQEVTDSSWVAMTLLTFLLLQTLLIAALQRSRLNNKRARHALRESKKELEQRIAERTESLNKINQLLLDEVARHESTGHQLRDTKEYLQSMINSMPSIIIGITAQGRVTHWNAAAENTFEIFSNDALGRNISRLLPFLPLSQERITTSIREGEPYAIQHTEPNKDELHRYFDITIYPLISQSQQGAVIRIDDVTLRITIENLMIQNEKMYSLGELAAGIAHEINNPLSVILQNVQNILRRTQNDFPGNQHTAAELGIDLPHVNRYLEAREIYSLLSSIREAGERSATIVTNMLEFSHSNNKPNGTLAIDKLLTQTLAIYNNLNTDSQGQELIRIETQIAKDLPLIKGSGPELQQVLLNLLRNAKQALINDHFHAEEPSIFIRVFRENLHLVIEVQDNGQGMTDNIRQHIFEPFYTTKAMGAGTGLGLSVSYFIITEHHQGTIEVKSSQGRGSTFIIKLPL